MYEFLCKHKLAIEKMNYYEWARYMEKVNDDSVLDHLLTKIEISTQRSNLSIYRHILYDEFERNTSHRILKYSQFLTNYRSQSMKNIYLWAITNGYNNI